MKVDQNTKIGLAILVVVVVGLLVWWYVKKDKDSADEEKTTEGFTGLAAGANTNIGTIIDDAYGLTRGADQQELAPHFADMVYDSDPSAHMKSESKCTSSDLKPMERLHRLQGEGLMPRVSSHVTPFNIDVANPTSVSFMANAPRVSGAVRSRLYKSDLFTSIVGDPPITYHPNIPVVAKSQYGVDSLKLNGVFSDQYEGLYNKYTGKEYRNIVQKVAGAGQASGYGGASGGVLLDYY